MENLVGRRNETQLVCLASFIAKEGEADKLLKNLYELIRMTTKEGGCIRYELNQCIEDPHRITFVEKWYDQITFDAHCATSYIKEFFKGDKPNHVVSYEVTLYKEIL